MAESGRLVFQLQHNALGELGADAGCARHHRLVLHGDGGRQIARRQQPKDRQRHFGANPLHGLQQAKPVALGI